MSRMLNRYLNRPLSRKRATALAVRYIGPMGFVDLKKTTDVDGKIHREYRICEMVAIADTRTHGRSNRSYREAFHNAGLFWEE